MLCFVWRLRVYVSIKRHLLRSMVGERRKLCKETWARTHLSYKHWAPGCPPRYLFVTFFYNRHLEGMLCGSRPSFETSQLRHWHIINTQEKSILLFPLQIIALYSSIWFPFSQPLNCFLWNSKKRSHNLTVILFTDVCPLYQGCWWSCRGQPGSSPRTDIKKKYPEPKNKLERKGK